MNKNNHYKQVKNILCPTLVEVLIILSYFRDVNDADLPMWKEYDAIKAHYINLDANITAGQHLFQDRVKFWLNDIQKIHNPTSSGTCLRQITIGWHIFVSFMFSSVFFYF